MSTAPRLMGKAESGDSVVDSLLKSSHQFRIYEVPDVKQHVPIVFFSSGTTGTPKGIEVSDFHVQLSGILFESRRESLLIASPLYWYSALGTLMSAIHQNHSMIITNSNDARYRLKLMEKYKVESFFSNMANMIQYINEPMFEDFDLSSVKTVLVGGEIILPSVARPFFSKVLKGRAKMVTLFGSTEAGVISEMVIKDMEMQKFALGACGRLVSGVEMKILDESGAPVPPGVMGRIWIKSPCTKGYWRRDDLNCNFLDDQGFYDTGDAGIFDSEGNLYLRGRICDLINFRGEKMSPAPLEDILMGHPAIQDAVVVGRTHPTDGQHPTAFVVIRPQHQGKVAEEDIRTYVDVQVEDKIRLRGGVHFRESLPRVSNGKVVRKMV
ncbi:uncharacterized protein LOC128998453 [Macrosteles quadrilineatus]|uniref:uncharacterized protein LOC128998453 n=1 Tax=Macrosteles quadrilineatus TaxID=74068 RepID=UPI0023E0FF7D|nr:uncharacterized protein LOC128998453 [Macrosteles quadrilineatus]